MADPGHPVPVRLPREERRAQILAAAARAFMAAGFDGTSMEGVAQAAGVTRLVVYRIFATKELLYRAVLSSVTDELVAAFKGRDIASIRRAGGIVRMMLPIARRHPDAFRLLWRQAAGEPLFAHFARQFRVVLGGYTEQVIRLDRRISDPVLASWCAAALAAHLLDGLCVWLDDGDVCLDDQYAVMQTCGLLALLDAWADPRPPEWLHR